MKILMRETRPGSPDGCRVVDYEAGTEYSVPEPLGRAFVGHGWATELDAPAVTEDTPLVDAVQADATPAAAAAPAPVTESAAHEVTASVPAKPAKKPASKRPRG